MSKSFFITGTGTDIGKTVFTCSLSNQLIKKGKSVNSLKPVISGWDNSENMDTMHILHSLGLAATDDNINIISPWRYAAPLSPDMAAARENREIVFDEVIEFCRKNVDKSDYNFIEGAGGAMVPLDGRHTYRDLIRELNIPVILVCGSYLGSISHTLTAIEALRDSDIHAIVINQTQNGVDIDNVKNTLGNFTDAKIFTIPYIKCDDPWQSMPDITYMVQL